MIETPDISALTPSPDDWDARRDRLQRDLRVSRRRWRRGVPALAVFLVAGTAAATAASTGLLSADDVIVDSVACLRTPAQDLDAATWIPTQPDPVAGCAALWERGPVAVGGAPPLVACAGRDEPVRVVPAETDAICGRLGLTPVGAGYEAFARTQEKARTVADSVMTARGGCPATAPPLFEAMRDALTAGGLAGWRVVPPERPEPVQPACRADVDARTRTVTLHHITPANRIYSSALGLTHGSTDEAVPVVYGGRTGCPPAAPLREALAEDARLRGWRVVERDDSEVSCRAVVDGRTRTITLDAQDWRR